jgi:hypothetical protein
MKKTAAAAADLAAKTVEVNAAQPFQKALISTA